MPDRSRLLVLGLDAASAPLVRRWGRDGTLPSIGRFLDQSVVADVRTHAPCYIGAVWPSFYTGRGPDHHGIRWLYQQRPGRYEFHHLTEPDFGRVPALWDLLSEGGRRVAVLDVPMSRASPSLRGVQILEWGVHDPVFGFGASPAPLGREILRTIGPHPAPRACDANRNLDQHRAFAATLQEAAARRSRLTTWLLGREPWDFAIQVFSETHCAGHQLWHFHDRDHPGFDPEATAEHGDLVQRVYQAVDRAVGDILAAIPADTTVVLLALHGMGPMAGSGSLLREVLLRLGATAPPAAAEPTPRTVRGGVTSVLSGAWMALPPGIRGALRPLKRGAKALGLAPPSGEILAPDFDPRRSRCFPLNLGSPQSGIRLNLKGREPFGLVDPAEAEALLTEITEALFALTDPDTGTRLAVEVRRQAELGGGPNAAELPDLLIDWDVSRPVGTTAAGTGRGALQRAQSPRIGVIERTNRYCRTGEHRPVGLVAARGPGITPGELERSVSTLDLAPTFARMLGVEMPGVGGQVIPELVRAAKQG